MPLDNILLLPAFVMKFLIELLDGYNEHIEAYLISLKGEKRALASQLRALKSLIERKQIFCSENFSFLRNQNMIETLSCAWKEL